jgi:hypothetical protein
VKLFANTETPYDAWCASACARADMASAARITLAICSGEHSPRTMAAAQARRALIATWFVTTNSSRGGRTFSDTRSPAGRDAAAKGSRGWRAYAGLGTSRSHRACLMVSAAETDEPGGCGGARHLLAGRESPSWERDAVPRTRHRLRASAPARRLTGGRPLPDNRASALGTSVRRLNASAIGYQRGTL